MGRPKIDTYWINLVRGFLKTEPRKSAKSIEISLAFIGPRLPKPRDDLPKERTIRDIAKRFGELTPERQQQYSQFHWPEAMAAELLPWEASAAALELLRAHPWSSRPLIRLVRWFWRVSMAVPDAPFEQRKDRAVLLAMNDVAESPAPLVFETVEGWMLYQPWTSVGAELKYQEAIAAGAVPNEQVPISSEAVIELAFWDKKPGAFDELRITSDPDLIARRKERTSERAHS